MLDQCYINVIPTWQWLRIQDQSIINYSFSNLPIGWLAMLSLFRPSVKRKRSENCRFSAKNEGWDEKRLSRSAFWQRTASRAKSAPFSACGACARVTSLGYISPDRGVAFPRSFWYSLLSRTLQVTRVQKLPFFTVSKSLRSLQSYTCYRNFGFSVSLKS